MFLCHASLSPPGPAPSRTIIGVQSGPDLPLNVSQLNSIASEFGTGLFGRKSHSCRISPKFRSTRGPARQRRILPQAHAPVLRMRYFETMPVYRRRLGQMIVKNNPRPVALIHLQSRPRHAAVVTPRRQFAARSYLRCNYLGCQDKLFNTVNQTRLQLS